MTEAKVEQCEFAEESSLLHIGRICRLDQCVCFNFDKTELIVKCPTLEAHKRGEPVGKTPNLNYAGMPHVVRRGRYGDFVTGMPPEYLTGKAKAKGE